MKKLHKGVNMSSAFLLALFSVAGFFGVATIAIQNNFHFASVSLANGGEDDGEEGGGDSQGSGSSSSESEKKAREAEKKKQEQVRETAKKAAERSGKGRGTVVTGDTQNRMEKKDVQETGEVEDAQDTDEDDALETNDDNGMFRDRVKTVSKLHNEITRAEEEILKKQAEGVDVTAALARLAEAKAKVTTVEGAFESDDLTKAKDLTQEVTKLTHFAKENDLHDAKEVAEKVSKVAKRLEQAAGKVALLISVGGNGDQFKSALSGLAADLEALKATIASGNYDAAAMSTSLETLERKVKVTKSSVEGSIYALGGTDSRYGDDYKNETEDVASSLKEVADIRDDNVGRTIRRLAESQEDSAKKVSESVSDVDKRNPVLQTLFGANESDLGDLEREIAANKARVQTLNQAANTIEDTDVKTVLLDQVAAINEQTTKLQTFVSGQRDRLSLFGWFTHLF